MEIGEVQMTQKTNKPLEVIDEPQANSTNVVKLDMDLAKILDGNPKSFAKELIPALNALADAGIAAEVDGEYMRGYKFHDFVK